MARSRSGQLRSTIERSIFQANTSRNRTRWTEKLCVMLHTTSVADYSLIENLRSLGAPVRRHLLTKPSAQSRPSGPGIGETPERLLESTAERSNIFGELTSYLQVPEHTGLRRPVSGRMTRPVSGAPTLTRSKLLLIGMKLLRRQFGRRQHSGKKLPQFREGRVGLRLRTAPLLTGPAASSHQRCFQRPHTYRH